MKRMMKVVTIVILAVMLVSIGVAGAGAQGATPAPTAATTDLDAATAWLVSQQNEDGGFPGFSGESGPAITVDAVIALAAAQGSGIDTQAAIDDAMAYLTSGDIALVFAQTGQGQAAKLVLAATAAGADPRDIAGVDALSLIEQAPMLESGLYGTGVFDHALVILALSATGTEVPAEAIAALETTRTPEGGWAFDGTTTEGAADSNTTALVVQALAAAGQQDSPLVADGLAYLLTVLDGSSGAVYQPGAGMPADSVSTAYVIQAVLAVGGDPASNAWGNLPAALAAFQNDSGALHFNPQDPSDNAFATAQAIPAAAGLAMPIVPAGDGATPVALWPVAPLARAA